MHSLTVASLTFFVSLSSWHRHDGYRISHLTANGTYSVKTNYIYIYVCIQYLHMLLVLICSSLIQFLFSFCCRSLCMIVVFTVALSSYTHQIVLRNGARIHRINGSSNSRAVCKYHCELCLHALFYFSIESVFTAFI